MKYADLKEGNSYYLLGHGVSKLVDKPNLCFINESIVDGFLERLENVKPLDWLSVIQ